MNEGKNVKEVGVANLVYDYILSTKYSVRGSDLEQLERAILSEQAKQRGLTIVSFDTRNVQEGDKLVYINMHKDVAYYRVARVTKTHVVLEAYDRNNRRLAYFDRIMNYCTSDDSNDSYEYYAVVE